MVQALFLASLTRVDSNPVVEEPGTQALGRPGGFAAHVAKESALHTLDVRTIDVRFLEYIPAAPRTALQPDHAHPRCRSDAVTSDEIPGQVAPAVHVYDSVSVVARVRMGDHPHFVKGLTRALSRC